MYPFTESHGRYPNSHNQLAWLGYEPSGLAWRFIAASTMIETMIPEITSSSCSGLRANICQERGVQVIRLFLNLCRLRAYLHLSVVAASFYHKYSYKQQSPCEHPSLVCLGLGFRSLKFAASLTSPHSYCRFLLPLDNARFTPPRCTRTLGRKSEVMKLSDPRSLPYWLSCKSSHPNHYTFLQVFYRFSGKRRPDLRSCLEALVRRSWLPQNPDSRGRSLDEEREGESDWRLKNEQGWLWT